MDLRKEGATLGGPALPASVSKEVLRGRGHKLLGFRQFPFGGFSLSYVKLTIQANQETFFVVLLSSF